MNLTKGNNASIDLGASGDFDPIWLDGKETEVSITLYEDAPAGDHVGSFYVKSGDTRDTSKWSTEVLKGSTTVQNGVLIHVDVGRLDLKLTSLGFLVGYTRTGGGGTVKGVVTIKRY